MTEIARTSLLIFSILLLSGGIAGFVKGKSKASLIAGVLSFLALIGCFFLSGPNPLAGIAGGLAVSATLAAMFARRFQKTKQLMPAGILLIACVCEFCLLAYVFLARS